MPPQRHPQIYYGTEVLWLPGIAKLGHGEERVSAARVPPEGRDPLERKCLQEYPACSPGGNLPRRTIRQTAPFPAPRREHVRIFQDPDDECVMVLINNGQQPVQVDWQRYAEGLGKAQKGKEVLSGMEITVGQPVQVPAQTAIFFTFAGI